MKKIIISLALIATALTALFAYKKIKSKMELFQSVQLNDKAIKLGDVEINKDGIKVGESIEINDKGVKVGDFEVNEQGIKGGELVQINDKAIKLGDVEVKLK